MWWPGSDNETSVIDWLTGGDDAVSSAFAYIFSDIMMQVQSTVNGMIGSYLGLDEAVLSDPSRRDEILAVLFENLVDKLNQYYFETVSNASYPGDLEEYYRLELDQKVSILVNNFYSYIYSQFTADDESDDSENLDDYSDYNGGDYGDIGDYSEYGQDDEQETVKCQLERLLNKAISSIDEYLLNTAEGNELSYINPSLMFAKECLRKILAQVQEDSEDYGVIVDDSYMYDTKSRGKSASANNEKPAPRIMKHPHLKASKSNSAAASKLLESLKPKPAEPEKIPKKESQNLKQKRLRKQVKQLKKLNHHEEAKKVIERYNINSRTSIIKLSN